MWGQVRRRAWQGRSADNALTFDETARFLRAANGPGQRFVAAVLLRTGMRKGELCHMRPEWVQWDLEAIRIPPTQYCTCRNCRDTGKWTPKTPASSRLVPIIEQDAREALRWFCDTAPKRLAQVREEMRVYRIVRELAIRAKIPHPVYPHALRATRAFQMAQWGLGAPDLMAIFGWTSIGEARPYITAAAQVQAVANARMVARAREMVERLAPLQPPMSGPEPLLMRDPAFA